MAETTAPSVRDEQFVSAVKALTRDVRQAYVLMCKDPARLASLEAVEKMLYPDGVLPEGLARAPEQAELL
jgi:hypothetical protein